MIDRSSMLRGDERCESLLFLAFALPQPREGSGVVAGVSTLLAPVVRSEVPRDYK